MIKKILLSAFLVVSAVQVSKASGEGDGDKSKVVKTANHAVTIDILPLASLEFTPDAEGSIFVFDNLTDLIEGKDRLVGKLKISSNQKWRVDAKLTGDPEILVGDIFTISTTNTEGSFVPFGTLNEVEFWKEQAPTHELVKDVFYKIKPGISLEPKEYNVEVAYTLTQQ
ncbi:hypothetical protein KI659_07790 [Litoribacter alkaliphilus]|uniref:DUF4402 domain-containing protein n=1 Tax=Litoribacter ruber TaxID=702568 RepID=A0AAP2CHN7_9BACT|nr:hypothetical protein [Litoribacter alkaliphilus]MBS9523914.1 hypothetical protein [Litoribacter alkaliphilus]